MNFFPDSSPEEDWIDEAALRAMQGLLSGDLARAFPNNAKLAARCYDIADAMLAEKIRRETSS